MKSGMGICFNPHVTHEKVIQAFQNLDLSYIENITEEARKRLKKAIVDGNLNGTAPNIIEQQILDIPNIQLCKKEVKLIVHTETMKGFNNGALGRYESHGVKEYQCLSANDERTCALCKSFDNRRFKIGSSSPVPPFHQGCRCTIVPVTD